MMTEVFKSHSFHSLCVPGLFWKHTWIIVSSLKIHTCDSLCVWVVLRSVMFSPDRHVVVSDMSVGEMQCIECMPNNSVCVHVCVGARMFVCASECMCEQKDVVRWQWRAPGCWILEMTLNLSILHSHGCRDGEHVCMFVRVCLRRRMRLCTFCTSQINCKNISDKNLLSYVCIVLHKLHDLNILAHQRHFKISSHCHSWVSGVLSHFTPWPTVCVCSPCIQQRKRLTTYHVPYCAYKLKASMNVADLDIARTHSHCTHRMGPKRTNTHANRHTSK